jgi:hypothetical protein
VNRVGLATLLKRELSPLLPGGDTEKETSVRNRPSPDTESGALILNFPASELEEINFYCLQITRSKVFCSI